ncbi:MULTISPECIES: homoserine dehydrogenase [unclassified Leifsonia]|uniref:homoserine dehydrogenase n=1 Tax=unclassified Leifsonia TaxID=2663824 RepID=UPI0008A7E50B|nr:MULTISPECIES: homoserine dehydrogenase [unclassified Leifsonia]SEI02902.1 homoserine dehydrogenase [Leifsonia sp. CL154]SFL71930.1 homoserine dehydrogenase [Leifsonia sp. CL147]
MDRYDLALIGFGGVNRALAELIRDRGSELAGRLGFELRVVAITDLRFGSVMQPDGVDLGRVLAMGATETFAGMRGGDIQPRNEEVIRSSTADIVVEATFTNPADGEPAVSHVRWALESGKHVTTTNKGPVALAGSVLKRIANDNGVIFEYEGSVLSGTPILRFAKEQLAGLRLSGVQGILNGTSNYVLGRMEAGLDLAEAVAEAQKHGYAEADPTADIEGFDVQLKVAILANELLGANLRTDDIPRAGISTVSTEDIVSAAREGKRWKLIGSAIRNADGSVTGRVTPIAVDSASALHGISGPTNAVTFQTDLLGDVTVSGPGAGRLETAYALLSDIIAIDRSVRHERVSVSNV